MRTPVMIPSLLGRRFRVDFTKASPPAAPLGWLTLAAGALALAMALADFVPRWIEHQDLRRRQEGLLARLDQPAGVARLSTRASDPIGLSQARAVLDQLERPWPALFDQFESNASTDVHLVQLGVDSRFQTVLVLAEAAKLEQVLQYARQLEGRGPVRAVRLTHHEWRTAPIGRIVVADLTADLSPEVPARKVRP